MREGWEHTMGTQLRLYHGSNVSIERPEVTLNTGFADLGHGFYLTDDRAAAERRAVSRAQGFELCGGGGGALERLRTRRS